MKILNYKQFLNESRVDELRSIKNYNQDNERGTFHAGGKTSNRVLIFDIDDTLLTGEVYIHIVDAKTGEYISKVNSAEFNTYQLKPGEAFDFHEFADPKIFDTNKITHYWGTMMKEYRRGSHIALLTARGGKNVGEMIRNYFLKHGVDIKEELVICINDETSPYTGTTAERKAQAMEELYNAGYDTMVFFDDNAENLEEAKKIGRKLGIKMVIRHAQIHRPDYEKDIRDYDGNDYTD